MKFTHYDLGHRRSGETLVLSLSGSAANVRLMDSANYQSFKARRNHRFYGGLATRSPVRLGIPHSGHWHVTVDLQGLRGNVTSSIHVEPGALRPLENRPLSSVPTLVRQPDQSLEKEFDVFISHASDDKDEVVRPLAKALRNGGLDVWYDEFELKIGDSLRRKIDSGLARSRFGVVVLSLDFFRKGWTNYELDGLVTRAVSGEQVLLPIWHNVSKKEVNQYSPSLADKLARSTSTSTVEEIAVEIIQVIKGQHNQEM